MTLASARSAKDTIVWSKWLTIAISIPVIAYTLAAYSSLTRSVWIDEFLHYALGSHRSAAEAWTSISATLPVFNHGQTGIHMLVDYWLLHWFGASAFALRVPSLLAATFLLCSLVQIGLRLRFNPVWTLLLLAAVFCQQNLMFYAGEARPYIMLAASVTGALAFYLTPFEQRTGCSRAFGGVALGMGVLFHPFFPVYWLAIAVYTRAIQPQPIAIRSLLPDFVRHCDAWLSIPAAVACLVLAKYTWLKGAPVFNMDPFEWIRADGLFYTFTGIAHFQFLGKAYIAAPIALALGLLAALVPSIRRSPMFRRLAPPLVLLALALGLSLFLSAISYFRDYWILPRQWVASITLSCLATIWLAKEIATTLARYLKVLALPVIGVVGYVLSLSIVPVYRSKQNDVRAVVQTVIDGAARKSGAGPSSDTVPKNNEEWVALANENIAGGGPVWPVFRRFYGRSD
jgi:hypothetical protein